MFHLFQRGAMCTAPASSRPQGHTAQGRSFSGSKRGSEGLFGSFFFLQHFIEMITERFQSFLNAQKELVSGISF